MGLRSIAKPQRPSSCDFVIRPGHSTGKSLHQAPALVSYQSASGFLLVCLTRFQARRLPHPSFTSRSRTSPNLHLAKLYASRAHLTAHLRPPKQSPPITTRRHPARLPAHLPRHQPTQPARPRPLPVQRPWQHRDRCRRSRDRRRRRRLRQWRTASSPRPRQTGGRCGQDVARRAVCDWRLRLGCHLTAFRERCHCCGATAHEWVDVWQLQGGSTRFWRREGRYAAAEGERVWGELSWTRSSERWVWDG